MVAAALATQVALQAVSDSEGPSGGRKLSARQGPVSR